MLTSWHRACVIAHCARAPSPCDVSSRDRRGVRATSSSTVGTWLGTLVEGVGL
jgi:hypothetical protein